MIDRSIALYGTDETLPEFTELRAGPVTAQFDAGQLRWIRVNGVEIIRAIAFLVRDRNWSTPETLIRNFQLKQESDSFSLEFDATCPTIDGNFNWHGSFVGAPDGTLTCDARGFPEQDFLTGRTGFVILHPLEGTVGNNMRIEHTDGSFDETLVPLDICPKQTFFDIRSMSHEPLPGLTATLRMEGDAWETEDHRNWTDASLKTYCRPLALPWPYKIEKGQELHQSVKLTCKGRFPEAATGSEIVAVNTGSAQGSVPKLGLAVLPEDAAETANYSELLSQLDISHLNCRLDLRDKNWQVAVPHYSTLLDTNKAELTLEIILTGDNDPAAELEEVRAAISKTGLQPAAVVTTPAQDLASYPPGTPFPDGVPTFESVAAAARAKFPNARIGGGMLSNFTELNRKRPPQDVFDFITHATSALVHAADDRSVMETLESIGHIIRSTKSFTGNAPYRIGPFNIGNSFNPYGSQVTPNPDNARTTMARLEPRHRGLFACAWTVGYLSQVADGDLEAATVAAPTGNFGVIYTKQAHDQPWFDTAEPRPIVYPLFHIVAGIAKGIGLQKLPLESSDPSRIRGVSWMDGDQRHIWIANLTAEPVEIDLKALGSETCSIAMLDEDNFEASTSDLALMDHLSRFNNSTLSLKSYAVARIVLES